MAAPVAALRETIGRQDAEGFAAAHDALTAGCNGCHEATGFAFNVVTRPEGNPYTNQRFAGPR
jgi:cytochrome c553